MEASTDGAAYSTEYVNKKANHIVRSFRKDSLTNIGLSKSIANALVNMFGLSGGEALETSTDRAANATRYVNEKAKHFGRSFRNSGQTKPEQLPKPPQPPTPSLEKSTDRAANSTRYVHEKAKHFDRSFRN